MRGRTATVTVAAAGCSRCAAGKGCGAGLFGTGRRTAIQLEIPVTQRLRAGDVVSLQLPARRLLEAAWLVYGLPLAGALLLPAAAGLFLGPVPDGLAAVLSLCGLSGGFFAGRYRLHRNAGRRAFVPTVECDDR